ncbi:potassium channel subfamily K member 18-like [Glandiceps talaboti]
MADETGQARKSRVHLCDANACTRNFQWRMFSWLSIVVYVLVGGILFKLTESSVGSEHDVNENTDTISNASISDIPTTVLPALDVKLLRSELLHSLHDVWSSDPNNWTVLAIDLLTNHEKEVRKIIESTGENESPNYNRDRTDDSDFNDWFNACFFCLTVITTIGYGHIYPITAIGKLIFAFYSVVGIPLFFLYLFKLGEHLATPVKRVYWYLRCQAVRMCSAMFGRRSHETNRQFRELIESGTERHEIVADDDDNDDPQNAEEHSREEDETMGTQADDVIVVESQVDDTRFAFVDVNESMVASVQVPLVMLAAVLIIYILICSAIMGVMENWDYRTSVYFCLVTMTTVGFGDILPTKDQDSKHLVVSMVIVFGLLLISICINLVWTRAARFAEWLFNGPCCTAQSCFRCCST